MSTCIYNINMFEWDIHKNRENILKHNVCFEIAKLAFFDENRIIIEDSAHAQNEERFFCFGKVHNEILTVRFVYRECLIRIFGAGYWRKGKAFYEKSN